jgi:exodeoxyribonuclease VII large subunit
MLAQAEAILWQRQSRKLSRSIGSIFSSIIKAGSAVRLQVRVDFHERFGYKLIIEDIDPAYTLGQIALLRNQNLEKLKKKGLLLLNAQHELPAVLQKVAVISAQKAAGLQDFLNQLKHNPYQYHVHIQFFEAAVQGERQEAEILKALKQIKALHHRYQAVAIIRGGGSRLDLAGFDNLKLCEAIARFPLPILTGIGHETDESLADIVAHTALKTPTALAEFILHRNLNFESQLGSYWQQISQLAQQQINGAAISLERAAGNIHILSQQMIREQQRLLTEVRQSVPAFAKLHLKQLKQQLDKDQQLVDLLHPEATLQRGYSLTTIDGKIIHSSKAPKSGDRLTTRFSDGSINSIAE